MFPCIKCFMLSTVLLYVTLAAYPSYYICDGFQPTPPLARLHSAQVAISRLSACVLAAGHTHVLHGRHTLITTLPNSQAARA